MKTRQSALWVSRSFRFHVSASFFSSVSLKRVFWDKNLAKESNDAENCRDSSAKIPQMLGFPTQSRESCTGSPDLNAPGAGLGIEIERDGRRDGMKMVGKGGH